MFLVYLIGVHVVQHGAASLALLARYAPGTWINTPVRSSGRDWAQDSTWKEGVNQVVKRALGVVKQRRIQSLTLACNSQREACSTFRLQQVVH